MQTRILKYYSAVVFNKSVIMYLTYSLCLMRKSQVKFPEGRKLTFLSFSGLGALGIFPRAINTLVLIVQGIQ